MNTPGWIVRAGVCLGTGVAACVASGIVSLVIAHTAVGEAWHLVPTIVMGPPAFGVAALLVAAVVSRPSARRPSALLSWVSASGIAFLLVATFIWASLGVVTVDVAVPLGMSVAVGGLPPSLLALRRSSLHRRGGGGSEPAAPLG